VSGDRRGKAPNARYRLWTEEEDRELARRAEANEPVTSIARALGRRVDSIRGRANRLGILVKTSVRPWRTIDRKPRES
jgi:hypothetical protein